MGKNNPNAVESVGGRDLINATQCAARSARRTLFYANAFRSTLFRPAVHYISHRA